MTIFKLIGSDFKGLQTLGGKMTHWFSIFCINTLFLCKDIIVKPIRHFKYTQHTLFFNRKWNCVLFVRF